MPVPKLKPEPKRASKESIQKLARDVAAKYSYRPEKPISTLVTALGGTWGYNFMCSSLLTVKGPRNFEIQIPHSVPTIQAPHFMACMLGHYVLHSQAGKKAIIVPVGFNDDPSNQEASWFAEALLSEPPSLSALDRILSEDDPFQSPPHPKA